MWTAVIDGIKKCTYLTDLVSTDIDTVNDCFTSVCSYSTYGLADILCYYRCHVNHYDFTLTVSVQ